MVAFIVLFTAACILVAAIVGAIVTIASLNRHLREVQKPTRINAR